MIIEHVVGVRLESFDIKGGEELSNVGRSKCCVIIW
jgi:hypothetical protein